MKTSAFVLCLLSATPLICLSGELRPAKLLAPLQDQTIIDGCSWSASSSRIGDGYIFLAEYDQSRVLMNIDGTDTELRLVSSRGDLSKVGGIATDTYRSQQGVVVYATYRATWTCPADNDSCEVTRYDATFEVTTRTRRQVVHATGAVGC